MKRYTTKKSGAKSFLKYASKNTSGWLRIHEHEHTRAHTNTKKRYKSVPYSYVLVCDICGTKLCGKACIMFKTHFAVVSVTIRLTIDSSSVWKY